MAGLNGHLDFGTADRLGMLVAFGAAGAARDAADAFQRGEALLDAAGQAIAFVQSGSRRGHEENGVRALVERGQEAGAKATAETDRRAGRQEGRHQDDSAMSNRPAERRFVATFEPAYEPAVSVLAASKLSTQQIFAEGGCDSERDNQRGQN